MNIISADGISRTIADKPLFENLSFGIGDGDKVSLIGVNGCGKTTLLRLVAGLDQPDGGTVVRSRDARIAYLPQIPPFDPAHTIEEHLFSGPAAHDRPEGWRLKSFLTDYGVTDLAARMGALSGGMQKKVALARVLATDAQLLILDEPTNHLDLDAILRLQEHLREMKKALFMVTHDRMFLDAVSTGIWEIDRRQLFTYGGGYERYLERKAERDLSLQRSEDKAENILRTELEWLRRGPKARATKSQDRKDRIQRLLDREQIAAPGEVELSITGRRLGKKILEVKGITKRYGGRVVLNPFSWTFKKNQKLGIVGPNGCGKTTLLNLLTGVIEPDGGTVEPGVNTCFGYFDQRGATLDPDMKVIDFIKSAGERIEVAGGVTISASQMLERFLFTGTMQYQPIGKLSGGEKRRLQLLFVLMKNPNFLILDEPTNDLDIKTLTILEDFLQRFEGCLLIVSHDRWFIDRCCEFLLVFDENATVGGFACDMSDYIEMRAAQKVRAKEPEKKEKPVPQVRPRDIEKKVKLTFKERLELDKLPAEIGALEREKEELEAQLSGGAHGDMARLTALGHRFEEVRRLIDEKLERWALLSEKEE
ncbi:MAG TPA: ABC-F family ATP-binding cassette domain-containing protein [bacterium]|nr:ABC-F family ATP-binding cassette domain-containing protein [bacterium]